MSKTKFCQGISDISDSYTGFILDQWGVLHDGRQVLPGVLGVLEELRQRNKEVIILSNSGKRAEESAQRMEKLGIGRDLYDHIVTGGEFTAQGLKDRSTGIFDGLGDKVYLISRGGDTSIINGLGLKQVDSIDKADFLLISGSNAPRIELDSYNQLLREAARLRLKAICANPDMLMLLEGKTYYGAGQIAKKFASFGGVVHYIGKPYQPIMKHCLSLFQNALPASVVMIGDSMPHDVMAGALAGVDSALIANGVHAKSFENAYDNPGEKDKVLTAMINNYGCKPNFLMNSFEWGVALPDRKHKKRRKKI